MLAPVSVEVGEDEVAQDEADVQSEKIEDEDGDDGVRDREGDDDDEDVEEAVKPLGLRNPGQPTQREIEEHELTHQPPRPWCAHCNGGRGQHASKG